MSCGFNDIFVAYLQNIDNCGINTVESRIEIAFFEAVFYGGDLPQTQLCAIGIGLHNNVFVLIAVIDLPLGA